MPQDEKSCLGFFSNRLSSLSLLDIGIGGGRTTFHLKDKVLKYTGIDYSELMIEVCRNRFPEMNSEQLQVGDVRSLKFSDSSFDLVFFSYNGLDSIGHEDRCKALSEMVRIIKPDGWLLFSSHNLPALAKDIFKRNTILGKIRSLIVYLFILIFNGDILKLRKKNWAVIHDDGNGFKMHNYYVNPSAQVKELIELGCKEIFIYNRLGEILNFDQALISTDPWLHYLAKVTK